MPFQNVPQVTSFFAGPTSQLAANPTQIPHYILTGQSTLQANFSAANLFIDPNFLSQNRVHTPLVIVPQYNIVSNIQGTNSNMLHQKNPLTMYPMNN